MDAVISLALNELWPKRIIVHSWNPDGAKRMAELAGKYTSVIISPFRSESTEHAILQMLRVQGER